MLGQILGRTGINKPVEAADWLHKAADQGDFLAEFSLGTLYLKGEGVPKDASQAAIWYRRAADHGYPAAQVGLGTLYRHGEGVAQDLSEAQRWYSKAESDVSPPSRDQSPPEEDRKVVVRRDQYQQAILGLADQYRTGKGLPQDYEQALNWYLKAADFGSSIAQTWVGRMYRDSLGVPKDVAVAEQWFLKAAETGHSWHQYDLGKLYADGGAYEKAFKWYRKAADQDHYRAQYELALVHHHGKGRPQDYAEALRWYRKAGDLGHPLAVYNLGLMYLNGKGVQQDDGQAYLWLTIAASILPGKESDIRPYIIGSRDDLAKRMTPSQAEEARRLATEWIDNLRRRLGRHAFKRL